MQSQKQVLKIMITANSTWNLANFRLGLIRSLQDDGHKVTALAPIDASASLLASSNINLRELKIDKSGTSPLKDAVLCANFREAFLRDSPDVVLSFTIKNNVFGGIAARMLGIPFVPNVSGLGTAFLSTPLMERIASLLYREACRTAPHVMFQNGDDRDLFLSRSIVQPRQAVLVPGSGIDLQRFSVSPLPGDLNQPVFLMIARLLRDKGVYEFVEAAKMLKRDVPGARFQLLGPASSDNRSAVGEAAVAGWEREGVIEYLGATDDVRPYISRADCVVLPSYREGTPRSLLEGAAMGRPLVTTDVPGCREVVAHGVNGFLCAPRDAQALKQAILATIAIGPSGRVLFGKRSRKLAEKKFGEAIVVAAYRNVIATVAENHARAVATHSL